MTPEPLPLLDFCVRLVVVTVVMCGALKYILRTVENEVRRG